jgi:hypothetical protein
MVVGSCACLILIVTQFNSCVIGGADLTVIYEKTNKTVTQWYKALRLSNCVATFCVKFFNYSLQCCVRQRIVTYGTFAVRVLYVFYRPISNM